MTINDFVNHSPFIIPEHIIVYGNTENSVCHETHKMYDSEHPKCQDGMSDLVKNATLHRICPSRDGGALILEFVTDEILYDYL